MDIRMNGLFSLVSDMRQKHNPKEQFICNYANVTFDVILDIDTIPFEMMIGAKGFQFACIILIKDKFMAEMKDNDFYKLCDILQLQPGKNTFTSFMFLKSIESQLPKKSSGIKAAPYKIARFKTSQLKHVEESDKIYFYGWNDHKKDGRQAKNFEKTKLFFGIEIENYCRKNNISSMWTDDPSKNKPADNPWE